MDTAAKAPRKARIEVISDVVCPWCYIGKHRLEQGLEMLGDAIEIAVSWRPYELNPAMPAAGMDRETYCERKFGSIEYARRLYANIAANAASDGLPMAVERISRTPNTRAAHRLIAFAEAAGCQDAVVDALFAAYFVEGRDVGDAGVLSDLAAGAGLERGAVRALLCDPAGDAMIESQERAAHELGVTGVPAFVFNGRLLFSGAQSATTVALAIERAFRKGL